MKNQPTIWRPLFLTTLAVIIFGVVATVVLTNTTLRSIEKNLPTTLLKELSDLSLIIENLAEVVEATALAQQDPAPEKFAALRKQVGVVYEDIIALRESYVLDNLVQASTFHAVVAPAISDLQIWLSEGVSGFGPQTGTTAQIALTRIEEAYHKARALNRDARNRAQQILERQKNRLDRFLFSVNLLFLLTIIITLGMVILLIWQFVLQRREVKTLHALQRTEQTLQESEELHRKLIATIPDIVLRMDLDGNILFVNEVSENITGYTTQEILGRNMLEFVVPEDQERVIRNSERMLKGPLGPREYRLTLKQGRERIFEVNADVLRDKEGTPYGTVGVLRDITERKQAEEALRDSEKQLARSRKMESLGLLAGSVAHDLNNVLSGIVSYPELILMDLPQDSKLRKPIQTMQASGQRAAAIVQDLLTVARGVAKTKESLNLNDLITDYLYAPEGQKLLQLHPSVSIRTQLDQTLFNIRGSHIHIRKMIMNLVVNASESIAHRGTVTISTQNRYVERPLRGYENVHVGEYAVIRVNDDGTGISADELERIFEPFYTKKVLGRSGTGLGLAVVWNVVQDHQGYIDVTSNSEGTTFEIYFPITREAVSAKDTPTSAMAFAGNGETILVVDDVQSQREITGKMLESLGYRPTTVASGEAALDYLKNHKVDLLLIDMIMDPGINGRETYERALEIHPGQRAVIISGFSETEDVKQAQALGAGSYVKKPFTLEALGKAVKTELYK